MKLNINDLRVSETKDIDVSRFFPTATEKVFITIRRLSTKIHNDVIAIMTLSGEVKSDVDGDSFSIKNTSWYNEARKLELLGGILQNELFPFETWNENFIKKLDERNSEFITLLQTEIQVFNRPLVMRKKKV